MKEIVLQRQNLWNSCVSACMAMMLDLPVKLVEDEFHTAYKDGSNNEFNYALTKGLRMEPCLSNEELCWSYVYCITAPSINSEALLHALLLDCRDGETVKIYDPAIGGRTYVLKDEEVVSGKTVKLISYSLFSKCENIL